MLSSRNWMGFSTATRLTCYSLNGVMCGDGCLEPGRRGATGCTMGVVVAVWQL